MRSKDKVHISLGNFFFFIIKKYFFIIKKKKLFIFKSKGAFNPIGVIQEYAAYLSHINLSPEDAIRYLKAICKHLDDEYGETYGGLIK
jgi:hypothetical protein